MSTTQNQRILQHMQQGKAITPIDALNNYGCMRLAARIAELKKQGHAIKSYKRRSANGATFSIYWIENDTTKP